MPAQKQINKLIEDLDSKDNEIRYTAFKELSEITEKKVEWVYDYWFNLVNKLSSENSFQRSIGLMLLANLCKSDNEKRFDTILNQYLLLLDDEKFITSRQCIQNIWKIAIINNRYKEKILSSLEQIYYESRHTQHNNLIKPDVINSLVCIYLHHKDHSVLDKAKALINEENDNKLKAKLLKCLSII